MSFSGSNEAKHEQLLDEEYRVVRKGMETTQSLLDWFEKRVESLEKRRKMLDKGMVALDSAVHEQKLNFYRAQITELGRRMKNLMASSERGFPTHANMGIRNQVAPPPSQNGNSKSNSDGTGTCSSASTNHSNSSYNSSPEPLQINFYKQQHQKLVEELNAKTRLIEEMQREKRLNETRQAQLFSTIDANIPVNDRNINFYGHSNGRPISVIQAPIVTKPQLNVNHRFTPIAVSAKSCAASVKIHDTLL
ncbi:hypothetical protein Ddc_12626 [Ditylenchus destructor]|nr:hypothetical protein Ddc_12626 [Ditylenchus destructor]